MTCDAIAFSRSVPVVCHGRDFCGDPALKTPVHVTVEIHRSPGSSSTSVNPWNCPHRAGSHGGRCKASHPGREKLGMGVMCPFSFDYPYARSFPGWEPPAELAAALEEAS